MLLVGMTWESAHLDFEEVLRGSVDLVEALSACGLYRGLHGDMRLGFVRLIEIVG